MEKEKLAEIYRNQNSEKILEPITLDTLELIKKILGQDNQDNCKDCDNAWIDASNKLGCRVRIEHVSPDGYCSNFEPKED
jgi:hypothetical protein